MNYTTPLFFFFLLILSTACHCIQNENVDRPNLDKEIVVVANSKTQWTGVAVSSSARIFASYPNWSQNHTVSVAEVTDTAALKPFPDKAWNSDIGEGDPANHFICVQSVFVDHNDFLWVLDAANIQRNGEYQGVVEGGAKLVKIDLNTNTVVQKIIFSQPVIKRMSYLNDVRIDENKWAYITDSNEGAIIVVNLQSGESRRLLDKDPSTKSENTVIVIDNKDYRNQQGKFPVVHADGIALSPDKTELYWRALTGRSLYKIKTQFLQDYALSDQDISNKVVSLASYLPPSDGMIFSPDGTLYFTSLEDHGVRAYDKDHGSRLIKKSSDFQWPDSFSIGPDGYLYVSTSQINIPNPTEPYRILKFRVL